jgi:hypothetical protein
MRTRHLLLAGLLALPACAGGPSIVASPTVTLGQSGGFISYRPPMNIFTLGGRERAPTTAGGAGPGDEITCQATTATCYRNGVPDPALSRERFLRQD